MPEILGSININTDNIKKQKEKPKRKRKLNLANDNIITKTERKPKKICSSCGRNLSISQFYSSNSQFASDRISSCCKDCMVKSCLDENNMLDVDKLKSALQIVNRPFISSVLEMSKHEFLLKYSAEAQLSQEKLVKIYFRNISFLAQYNSLTYEQGLYVEKKEQEETADDINRKLEEAEKAKVDTIRKRTSDLQPIFLSDIGETDDDFELTPDIIRKFGEGYTINDYANMEKKYRFLSQSYPELTNLHIEALCNYVRPKVLAEKATAMGDIDTAERWESIASKAAEKGRLNVSQLSSSDLQGGLNSFSEIMLAIEQAVDIIDILPRFRYQPNDAVDFAIWNYVNYIRRTEGKPECAYEDVYKFYDEKKHDYISQYGDPYGIFKDDPTEKNREKIELFIKVPDDGGGADASTEE